MRADDARAGAPRGDRAARRVATAVPAIADDAQVAVLVSMLPEEAAQIIASLIAEIEAATRAATEAAAAGRWAEVPAHIHVLTNATRTMGIESLVAASTQLGQDAGDPALRDTLMLRLRAVSRAAIHALESYLPAQH